MQFKWFVLLAALMGCFCHDGKSQTTAIVSGKLVLDSSRIAKKLYGRLPVFHGSVTIKNQGPATVNLGGADINLALSTIPTISSSEGQALTTQAYQKQTPQKVMNIVTLIASGVGLASGIGGGIQIGMKALAYLLFGVSFGEEGLVPFFQAGNPALPSFSPCDQQNVSLSAGQQLVCDEWVEKPEKGSALLPSVVTFDLESVPPTAPLPPVPPTVQLRRKISALITPALPSASALAVPALNGAYPQCWTAAEDGMKYCRNTNGVIFRPDLPQGTPNVLHETWEREDDGAVFHINPDGPGLAAIPVRHAPSAWAATIDTDNLPWIEDKAAKSTYVPSAKITVNYGWASTEKLSSMIIDAKVVSVNERGPFDPADDLAQVKALADAALPELNRAVAADLGCARCWRALGVAWLLLGEDSIAQRSFQQADDLESPRVLKLAGAR